MNQSFINYLKRKTSTNDEPKAKKKNINKLTDFKAIKLNNILNIPTN